MAETNADDALRGAPPRWWDRTINWLVPIAFLAAMIAYAFPFITPSGALLPNNVESGFSLFFGGFFVAMVAPLDPFFEAFSLPLIAAVVGLLYRRPGWIGSVVPLACAIVGLLCLGSAYLLERPYPLAHGYYAAEGSFLVAAIACAVRLFRLSRNRALWDARATPRDQAAASAAQQLMARYRGRG